MDCNLILLKNAEQAACGCASTYILQRLDMAASGTNEIHVGYELSSNVI